MASNLDNRKKAMIISVLAFLVAGGGVFLFFIVQGSNDLTGKGKNARFSYGSAAREGVSSFFRSVGLFPEERPELSASAVDRLDSRGLPLDMLGITDPNPDISDWMGKDKSRASASASGPNRPAKPTKIAKMSRKALPGVGRGGGGSKSAGSVSRFGAGSGSGETSISDDTEAGKTGKTGKGTLGALKNSKNLLAQGLRSDSAHTARDKWGQSFGVDGNKAAGGKLAYNKGGLVDLDKIKSGDIASLKMDKSKSLTTPDVTSPIKDKDGTKAALSNDKNVKKAAADKLKEQMANDLANSAASAVTNGAAGDKPDDKAAPGPGADDSGRPEGMSDEVWDNINGGTCGEGADCSTAGGDKYTDASRSIQKDGDNWICEWTGTQKNADGTEITYTDKVVYGPNGLPVDIVIDEKPL